jgi:uncharacterized membrane protein YhaH (DUF805 family)
MNEYKAFWKRRFDFKGISSRKDYWMAILFNFLLGYLPGMIFIAIGMRMENYFIAFCYISIYYLAMLIPMFAITIRRLHDINKSAWNLLFALIPYVGGIVILVFLLLDSNHINNKYIDGIQI